MKSKLIAFGILSVILIASCNARKSEVAISKVEEKKDLNISVSGDVENNVKVTKVVTENNNITTIVKTAVPIDPTKPSHYTDSSGRTQSLTNAKYTETQSFDNSKKESKTDATDLSKSKQNAELKDQGEKLEKEKEKNIDKKEYSIYNLLWLLIPVGLSLLYMKYIKKSVS